MATSNGSRDQTLTVGIKTSGEQALRDLAQEVRGLAKAGGDAAPAYQTLATELDRLADQAAGIGAFKQLAADVDALTERQREAGAAAAELQSKLAAQQAVTRQFAEAQGLAARELRDAQDGLRQNRSALEQLNAETARADRTSAGYLQSVRALRAAIVASKDAVYQKRQALNDANDALSKAEAAESKIETAYNRSAKAAAGSAEALERTQSAMREAGRSAEALGVDLTNVAAAEQRLLAEQQRVVAGAQDAASYMRFWAQAADELAAKEAEAAAQTQALARAQQQGAAFAQELIDAELRAAAALRETAAAATRANEASLAASKQADYVRFWAQAADELAKKEREAAEQADYLAKAGERASAALREAFGQTGVRGLRAIEAEVQRVNGSMAYLEQQFRAGAISAQDLSRAVSSAQVRLAQLSREAETIPALPGAFERLSSSINNAINRFGALGAAIATVGVAVKPVLDATIELERMGRVLTSVTGSSAEAARQIEFLRNVSQRAGQSFGEVGNEYAKFAAAALGAGVSLTTVQKTFETVALAAGNLGLTTDQTSRILNALGQSASKGVIQMEELRGQLGDALPGAMTLLAKGLGLTDAQLIKVIESGNLLARDALPALADALVKLGPKDGQGVTGLVAEFTRLKNVVLEASTILTESAFGRAAGVTLGALAVAIERVSFGIAYIGESFTVVGRQIGATVAAIVNRDFKNLGETLDQIADESARKLEGLAQRIEGTGAASSTAATGAKTLGDSMREAALQVGKVTDAQAGAGAATAAAGQAAAGAVESWVQLSVKLAENVTLAEKAAVVADTVAKAKKIEAEAAAAVIAISGNEAQIRAANARAATSEAAALQAKANADALVAQRLREGIAALEERARADGRADDATKKALDTLKQKLAAADADAEKTRQQADAARVHAAALDVQARSLQDNGNKVQFYRAELDRAATALASAIRAMERDKATKEDVQRATEAVAKAEGLLRDAISDRARQTEQAIEIMKADHAIKRAGIQVQIEESKAAEILAKARGDERTAALEAMKQRQLEIELARDNVALTIEEAQARKAAAEAELADTANLLPEKKAELELRIKNAEAKIAEAKAGSAAVKVLEAERTAIIQRNAAQTGGSGAGSGGGNGLGAQRVSGGGGATYNPTNPTAGNIDGSGMGSFSSSVNNPSGIGIPGGGAVDASYVFDLWARFQQGRVTADELPAIRNALAVAEANARLGGPGSVSFEGKADDQKWISRLKQIIDALDTSTQVPPGRRPTGASGTTGGASVSTAAPAASAASSAGRSGSPTPVVINIEGVSRTVNVAGSNDAAALQAVLAQLVQAQGRAS